MSDGTNPRATPQANRMTRRGFLGLTLGASAGALAACAAPAAPSPTQAPGTAAPAASKDFNWKKYAGTTLRYVGWNDNWSSSVVTKLPDFEQLTGIKVVWDLMPQDQGRQKVATELTAKNKDLDLTYMAAHVDTLKYLKAGWIHPIDEFLADPSMMPPDLDIKDFAEGQLKTCNILGKQTCLPTTAEAMMFIYRKDIFEQKGLKPPTSMEELEAAVAKVHNPPDVVGMVNRGTAQQVCIPWSSFLYSFGGDYLTKDRKPDIASPGCLASIEYFAKLSRQDGPPGMTTLNWPEAAALVQSGRAATMADNNTFRNVFNDPEKSKVIGKVGYAMLPKGPAQQMPGIWSGGSGICAYSEKKGAAWYFMMWSTSKAVQNFYHAKGVPSTRTSVWNSPEGQEVRTKWPDWADTTLKTLQISNKGYSPEVVAVMEVRNRVGEVLVKAIQGTTGDALKAEAEKANRDIVDIMSKTEG